MSSRAGGNVIVVPRELIIGWFVNLAKVVLALDRCVGTVMN